MCPGGGELGRISLSPPPAPRAPPGAAAPGTAGNRRRRAAAPGTTRHRRPRWARGGGRAQTSSPHLPTRRQDRGSGDARGSPNPGDAPHPRRMPGDRSFQPPPPTTPPPPPPRRLRQPRPLTKPRRSAASRPPREYRLPGSRRGNPHGPRHHGNPGPGSHRYSLTSFP